jgi:hypothetical protein
VMQWLEHMPRVLGSTPVSTFQRSIYRTHIQSIGTSMSGFAAQTLVVAITGKANRLLYPVWRCYREGVLYQNPEKAVQFTHTQKQIRTVESSICGLRLYHICETAPSIAGVTCCSSGSYKKRNSDKPLRVFLHAKTIIVVNGY